MTAERWQRIEELYHRALEVEPEVRTDYLERNCAGDGDLQREVESLLSYDASSPRNPLNRPVPALDTLAPGMRLGPYEILAPAGTGGMGRVWKAFDGRLGRTVAIKVAKAEFTQRAEREARAVAALNHPNICTIHDIGPNYFVMEYVEGKSLRDLIPPKGLPLKDALDYAAQISCALAAAHAAGVIHRDLKPGNIMIGDVPDAVRVKVVDFGLARLSCKVAGAGTADTVTAEGTIAGTVAYMSPEQAQGLTVDARSDIFSFGSVLYEMLTGKRAFQGDSPMSTLAGIIDREPQPIRELAGDLPAELESLVGRCLRKDPARRWQNMADLHVLLLDLVEAPRTVLQPSPVKRGGTAVWWKLGAAALIAAACVVGGAMYARWRAPKQEVWTGALLGGPLIASHPRVSPDGQLLAFRAIVNGQAQLAVMKPDAASWTVLTHDLDHGAMEEAAWSRDGSKIYFDREGADAVYSIAPLGGEPRLEVENASMPEPLPDGSLLVARNTPDGLRQILRVRPDTGAVEELPAKVTRADARLFAAFPDGKEVAVLGHPGEPSGPPRPFILELATHKVRSLPLPAELADLTDRPETAMNPRDIAVSADGQSVLELMGKNETLLLVAVPRNGSGRARILTSFPLGAAPLMMDSATDGSIYVDQSTRELSVVTLTDSGKILRETRVPKDLAAYVPLPTGAFIFGLTRGKRARLLMSLNGAEPSPAVNTDEDVWSPAALLGTDRLIFRIGHGDSQRLAICSIATGRVLKRFSFPAAWIPATGASPDGRTVYYLDGGLIWAQDVQGGEPRKIGAGSDFAIDPSDGTILTLLDNAAGRRLIRIDPRTGAAQPIQFPPGVQFASRGLAQRAVNRDGRILMQISTPTTFFYQTAILDPHAGKVTVIPSPPQSVISQAAWLADGNIMLLASRWSSTLLRYRRVGEPKP